MNGDCSMQPSSPRSFTARGYDWFMVPWERLGFSIWRKQLIQHVEAPVLEVGIGTGASLSWYDGRLTAIEPDGAKLRAACHKAGPMQVEARLLQMDVQHLAFPSAETAPHGGFATIVASLVFCTVPDPVKGLRELKRVLRPGGTLLLMEHVRPEQPVLGKLVDGANVPWQLISQGCQINRNTAANVAAAGFEIVSIKKRLWGLLNQIVARRVETLA
jgi:ubiquinone/menaquinone biosynthesis C-methylase UbiE